MGKFGMSWLPKLERLLLILGVLMVGLYVAARIHQSVLSKAELVRSWSRKQGPGEASERVTMSTAHPDFSLWSEKRIKEYQESLAAHFAPSIVILRIPKIQLEVPVLEGTDDLTLNRGVGHIAGTANPGEHGNMAIAGHRDGFFRGLKDIGLRDTIEIVLPERTETYVIDHISIVDPSDVSVLQPRPRTTLTLVTCYPFYFVGSAPQRYIVEASVLDSAPASDQANRQSATKPATFDPHAGTR